MNKKVNLLLSVTIYLIMALFSGASQVLAQQEHGHKSPHGGEVRTMGDYHVEFLVVEGDDNEEFIVVYLLNKDLVPIPVGKNVEGVVYLTLSDKTKQTLKLVISAETIAVKHHDEEHEEEEHKDEEHEEKGEHNEEMEHGDEVVSYLRARLNLEGLNAFDAVVSIKIDQTRKNLRFKYAAEEHGDGENGH